jgi:hypothetical protein
MPQAAEQLGAVDKVVDLQMISREILLKLQKPAA